MVAYAAQIAAQLGANIVKVKLPTEHLELDKDEDKFEEHSIARSSVADRVRYVMKSTFNGRRIVVFSGGSKASEESFLEDIRGIYEGGGNGSIIGRNSFQRPKDDAVRFLGNVMDIYQGKSEAVFSS